MAIPEEFLNQYTATTGNRKPHSLIGAPALWLNRCREAEASIVLYCTVLYVCTGTVPVKRHRGEPGHTRTVPVKRHRGEPGHTRDTYCTGIPVLSLEMDVCELGCSHTAAYSALLVGSAGVEEGLHFRASRLRCK